jgi:hypothetical protein
VVQVQPGPLAGWLGSSNATGGPGVLGFWWGGERGAGIGRLEVGGVCGGGGGRGTGHEQVRVWGHEWCCGALLCSALGSMPCIRSALICRLCVCLNVLCVRGYCGSLQPQELPPGSSTQALLVVPVDRRYPMIR